jgi:predicted transcriptional regulator
MNKHKTTRGFVALTSTLMVSLILTTVTAALLYTSAQMRFEVESTEYKAVSRVLARACIDESLAQLLATTLYHGDATTTNPGGTCYTYPIDRETNAETLTVAVRAVATSSYTTLVATVAPHDVHLSATPGNTSRLGTETPTLTMVSLREVASY